MRAIAREFSATTRVAQENLWELRLLSQPFYTAWQAPPVMVIYFNEV
jgi:hypothetical protein